MNHKEILGGLKSSSILVIGNVISQLIALVSFSIVASGLGPILYGAYVTVLNFLGIFNFFTLTGLNKLILRDSTESNIKTIFNEYFNTRLLLVSFSILICIITLFFMPYEEKIKMYVFYFSILLAVDCLIGYISNYFIIVQNTTFLSFITISSQAIRSILNILLISYGYGVYHLLCSMLFIQGLVLLILYLKTYRILNLNVFNSSAITIKNILAAGTFTLIGFFSFLSLRINITIVSIIGDESEVGIYATALILTSFFDNIRNTVSTVFIPITSKYLKNSMDSNKLSTLSKFSLYLFIIITPVCIFLSYFSDIFFGIIFNDDYASSADIFSILIFYVIFSWLTLPLTLAVQVLNLQFSFLKILFFMSLLNIIISVILYNNHGLIVMSYGTILVYFLGSVFQLIYLREKLKAKYINITH